MIRHGNNWISEDEARRLGVHPQQIEQYCYQDRLGRWHDKDGKYCTPPSQPVKVSRKWLVFGVVVLVLFIVAGFL